VQIQHEFDKSFEYPGYFPVRGAHLYTVLHEAEHPVARVLLAGPFASERHYSYIPCVQWARFLAAHGVECLRYDYRGVGESTGVFEEMSFDQWRDDVRLLAAWLKEKSPDLPLVLHGLDLGAVLAGKAFECGIGDALLLWAAPASAHQALKASLLRRAVMDQAFKYGGDRKPASSYIEELENGGSLEVEGYSWTSRLWKDAFALELPAALVDGIPMGSDTRPLRSVKLGKNGVPLIKGTSVGYEAVGKDFTALFTDNLEWIIKTVCDPSTRPA
jgi:pimeloyl-ACP methyl ester carboxylesterase